VTVSGYGVDPNEGLQEAANLWLAECADDLRRVLVLHPPIRQSTDAGEALWLLEKFRATEPDTIVQTAVLLLTDPRWKGACGQVVRGIESRDLLEDAHLDLLARTFLAADDAVYWTMPDQWFEGGAVIVLDDEGRVQGIDSDEVDRDDIDPDEAETDAVDSGPTVARREVHRPLRRWAAERVVRGDPSFWPGVMKRSDELGGRRGAFVALGLLDALDVLPDATQNLLVERATRAPDQAVRLAGYERLAVRVGADIARERAKRDPSAKVRAWAAKPAIEPATAAATPANDTTAAGGEQSSLF
jgi:hypothetical protein